MRKILAAVSRIPHGDFSIEELDLEEPRADELLVKIRGVGLCHSDLLARDGALPMSLPAVFGHEGAGEVVRVGRDVSSVKAGDHVAISFGSCGVCGRCHRGDLAYCDQTGSLNYSGGRPDGSSAISGNGERIGGHFFGQSSFATYALTRERNAVVLPKDTPIALMGPLGCGVQTGAGAIMNTLKCQEGSSLLITGGGSLGLSALLAAKVQRCETIIVSEPHESRRKLATELGATHVIDPFTQDIVATVRALLSGGVDYVFDATGLPDVIAGGLASLGMRGILAIAGVPPSAQPSVPLTILPLVAMGQTVKGLVEGDADPKVFLPYLASLYQAGRFPIDRLITTYPLAEINTAVRDHEQGRCVKAVLLPN